MQATAGEIIAALGLEPLPGEGGYFRATWRSPTASAILFLLTRDEFSALHRLQHDELWHFHGGDPVEHVRIDAAGARSVVRLGSRVLDGERPQLVVPAGSWQGARLARGEAGWALLGCTVSPPWDERGFELGGREALLETFPAHAAWVRALTR